MDEIITKVFGNKLRIRVSGILLENETILLVAHKRIGSSKLLWAPPGGGMHFGEDAVQCLKREFVEETHLDIQVGDLLFVNEYLEHPLHAVELFFEITEANGILKPGLDPEMPTGQQIITEAQYKTLEEIKSDPDSYHSIFKEVENLQQLKNLRGYYKNINLP